jgi:diaminopimelate decarboxylase
MKLENGQYMIGAHTVTDLCAQYGTPLYIYDRGQIQKRIKDLRETIGQFQHTEFLYAVKANYNPHLVSEIVKLGCGVDAVCIEEVKLGLACGAAPENIMFTENNITDEEMHEAVKLGILLNVGSMSRLEKFGQAYPGARVSIRFNPNIGLASHDTNITGGPDSKFGISFRDVRRVIATAAKYDLNIVGVHQHIGSGWLRMREPLLALDLLLEIAEQIPNLEFVDIGGGLGIPYAPDEKELDAAELGSQIYTRMEEFVVSYGSRPVLRFEPGRYVIAEAGHLCARVNTIKQTISRKTVAATDTGMNHLVRPAMYGSYHHIVNVSNPKGFEKEYDIVGNICECADYFARDRSIPEIVEGDILCIENAGAYGMSMASNYQFRGLPAEILVDGQEIREIRKRETFEDLLSQFDFEPIQGGN